MKSRVLGQKSFLSLIVLIPCLASPGLAAGPEISTSGLLVEEVMAQSKDPRGFDWRRSPLAVEVSYSSIDEANVFESQSYGLGLARSLSDAWLLRLGLRRVETAETVSSRHMSLSIYSQAAQPSRYEISAGTGYFLLDGRSATPLSPKLSDIGHAALAIANIQYNYFGEGDRALVPGMRAVYYDFVGEVGVRFQAYFPQSLGAAVEWTYSRPLTNTDPDIPSWQRIGASVSWTWK